MTEPANTVVPLCPTTACDRELAALLTQLFPEFRAAARRAMLGQDPDHTLQPTALVNATLLRLIVYCRRQKIPADADQLRALFHTCLGCVLTDHNRKRSADKREGGRTRIPLEGLEAETSQPARNHDHLVAALEELRHFNSQHAAIIELRFYSRMSQPEVAATLGIPLRTVQLHQRQALDFLRRRLRGLQ